MLIVLIKDVNENYYRLVAGGRFTPPGVHPLQAVRAGNARGKRTVRNLGKGRPICAGGTRGRR
jgi:hypothetical protein